MMVIILELARSWLQRECSNRNGDENENENAIARERKKERKK